MNYRRRFCGNRRAVAWLWLQQKADAGEGFKSYPELAGLSEAEVNPLPDRHH